MTTTNLAAAGPSPQALAEACAEAMWAEDAASQRLGMRIERIAPSEATLSMQITDFMVNGHGLAPWRLRLCPRRQRLRLRL